MNLFEVSKEIADRLTRIFLRDDQGRRPVYGGTEKFQNDPYWRDHILFYEYFHGDNGAGLGASHQTGWTGLVAKFIQLFGLLDPQKALEVGKRVGFIRGKSRGEVGEMNPWPRHPVIYEINTWVWLHELSVKHNALITLKTVPEEEWDAIGALNVDAVWFMGVWERSPDGITVANKNEGLLADFRRALSDYRPKTTSAHLIAFDNMWSMGDWAAGKASQRPGRNSLGAASGLSSILFRTMLPRTIPGLRNIPSTSSRGIGRTWTGTRPHSLRSKGRSLPAGRTPISRHGRTCFSSMPFTRDSVMR